MIKEFIKWYLSPTEKPLVEEHNIYDKLTELENRIRVLEEENVGMTNALYEMENALEARIDILTAEKWINKDV